MYDDFKELLSVLKTRSVKYLVVGGYAAEFIFRPGLDRGGKTAGYR
jgi:hypothetical protein